MTEKEAEEWAKSIVGCLILLSWLAGIALVFAGAWWLIAHI